MPSFDKDKCRQRNRLAAKRDGINAAPVLLVRGEAETWELARRNALPATPADCLAAINALLPEGAEPLTEEQVYLHFAEAANTNFVGDRYLFLDRSTLKNVARQAGQGVAFMNSHRTGGMSHPSELPFGKTFCGRYEEDEQGARAIVGLYMLRGVKPNGDSGPSTDDLDAQIRGGALADVSVGLYGGQAICDVCGEDLNGRDPQGYYLCPHIPGTDYEMSEQQKRAQKGRGVPDGACSYSLVDATFGEISGVYDGAVPGAGFRKAVSLSRTLMAEHLGQCRAAYVTLARETDFAESGPDLLSFEDQLDQALAAVAGCIERAEGYRNISAGRLAQIDELVGRWQGAREQFAPKPELDLQALQRKAIARRAALNRLAVGS